MSIESIRAAVLRKINSCSCVILIDQPLQVEPGPVAGRVRLSGKTIGVQRPSRDRIQEDMAPLFDRLWAESGRSEPAEGEQPSTHASSEKSAPQGGPVSRDGNASLEIAESLSGLLIQPRAHSQTSFLSGQSSPLQCRSAIRSRDIHDPLRPPLVARLLRSFRAFVNAWRSA